MINKIKAILRNGENLIKDNQLREVYIEFKDDKKDHTIKFHY
jgi:hypothetical protein